MIIDLSAAELKLFEDALDAWCEQGAVDAIKDEMVKAHDIGTTPTVEGVKAFFALADKTKRARHIKATLMKAKLYQAMNRASEHEMPADEAPKAGGQP